MHCAKFGHLFSVTIKQMLLAVAVTSILTWFIMANYLMWWQQLLHLNQLTKISTVIKHSCQRAKHETFLHNKSINVTTVTEVWSASTCLFAGMWHPWWVLLQHSIMLQLFFIAECGTMCFLCAVCVLEVWASSSSPWLTLCQISFLLQPPLLS